VDQWVSGGRRSHGGAEARRKQREEPTTRHKGNWRVPCSCLCIETPVVAHRCFTPPRSSILCGCINIPGRQVNAVWGRCPTACAIYVKKYWSLLAARRQNLSRLRVEKPGCAGSRQVIPTALYTPKRSQVQSRGCLAASWGQTGHPKAALPSIACPLLRLYLLGSLQPIPT
jgi:hypothetical protein